MGKTISREELHRFAVEFVENIKRQDHGATIVSLSGELGAGKTTFTQEVAKCFGIKDVVTSPTFVIEKIYKLEDQKFSHLIHIDAYRLDGGSELEKLGWDDLVRDDSNIIFVEWPENVSSIIPKNSIKISFEVKDENSRNIEVVYG